MGTLQHYLRYGASIDKKYFQQYQEYASTIVFNANTICHQSKNTAELLHVDLSSQEYIIDPKTYAYQMDIKYLAKYKSEKIKQTYQDLLSNYKLPATLFENNRPISQSNIQIIYENNFVENVLNFQENYLFDSLEDDMKIMVKRSQKIKEPKFLIAPYFLLNEDFSFWLDVNTEMINKSLEIKENYNKNIYAILLITKKTLVNEKYISQIIEAYSKADGLIFWINDFKEHEVSEKEIEALTKLITIYKEKNCDKEIISLYGGYFSQLLYHLGLDGVCHNVIYGESRSLNPAGSAPTHKYYLPTIKQKINPFDMLNILRNYRLKTKEEFYAKICDCTVCKKNIYSNSVEEKFIVYLHDKDTDKKIELSRDNCTRHYLECKIKEYENIPNQNLKTLIKELEGIYNNFKENNYLNNTNKVNIEYLKRWSNVLDNIS